MKGNSLLLNCVFTRSTFEELLCGRTSRTYEAAVRRYTSRREKMSNSQLIGEIYRYLSRNYRNEYFFKNTLLNKLLLGRHSLRTTTALTEVPVARSKADFVLVNGKAAAYEIKTELDNFDRLNNQIEDYYKAFDCVSVVASESNYSSLKSKLLNPFVGIYVLTNRNSLSEDRKPREYRNDLDPAVIFKILRKREFESVLLDYYGMLPKVDQFKYYRTCRDLFCRIDIETSYKAFLKQLKKRAKVNENLFASVPYELRFLIYFLDLKEEDYTKLEAFLGSEPGG